MRTFMHMYTGTHTIYCRKYSNQICSLVLAIIPDLRACVLGTSSHHCLTCYLFSFSYCLIFPHQHILITSILATFNTFGENKDGTNLKLNCINCFVVTGKLESDLWRLIKSMKGYKIYYYQKQLGIGEFFGLERRGLLSEGLETVTLPSSRKCCTAALTRGWRFWGPCFTNMA